MEEFLRRKLESTLKRFYRISKEDLQMPNHLVGVRRKLLKLEFNNVSDLLGARKLLMPIVESNKARRETADSYVEVSL